MNTRFVRRAAPRLNAIENAQARVLQRQRKKYSFPYYSTVRFDFARTGAGPFVYAVPQGTQPRAFSYAINDTPTSGGFRAAFGAATAAETNLQSKNETIGGEEVRIKGIQAAFNATSDARASALVFDNVYCELTLNGDQQRMKLGRISHLPGGTGLVGVGPDATGVQAIGGGRPQYGAVSNGWAVRSNCQRLPEGLVWRNKATVDSNLNIICTSPRAMTLPTVTTEAAAAGIRGYTAPADGEVNSDVTFALIGQTVSRRTTSI